MRLKILVSMACVLVMPALASTSSGDEKPEFRADPDKCKSLDIREFGLISDGGISEPWSEVLLIEKYGPPCEVLYIGQVYIERRLGKVREIAPFTKETEKLIRGEIAEKKQYIYWGDYSNRTSIITITGGVVTKKERIYP